MFCLDAISKIFNTLFGEVPFLTWKTTTNSKKFDRLNEALETVTNWMITASGEEFPLEMYDSQSLRALFGNGYMMIQPRYDTYSRGEACVGASFEAIDFFDILPPVTAYRGGAKAPWMWRREYLHKDDVAKLFEKGTFKGSIEEVPGGVSPRDRQWHKELLAEIGWTDWRPDKEIYEVYHQYKDGHIISILNRGYIARDTAITTPKNPPFPYHNPVLDMRYVGVPKEWFAIGIPEILANLQLAINLLNSQHFDNVDLILNAVIKVRRDSGVDPALAFLHPGALWWVRDMDDMAVEAPEDVTSGSWILNRRQLYEDAQNLVGQHGYSRGEVPPHGRETASTVIRLQQASLGRMETQVKLTELGPIRMMGRMLGAIAKNKLHKGIFEDVTGVPPVEVFRDTDDFAMKYMIDAVPRGSAISAVREIRTEQLMELLQIMTQVPPELTQNDPSKPFRYSIRENLEMIYRSKGLHQEDIERALPAIQPGPAAGPQPKPLSSGMVGNRNVKQQELRSMLQAEGF